MKKKIKASLIVWRILLLILILATMTLIFFLSHQDGKESGETSKQVTTAIAQSTVKDFDKKDPVEQNKIITDLNIPVRTLAHMAEFGLLSVLTLLFLLTWQRNVLFKYFGSVAFTFLYACTDEWHQKLVSGRAAEWKDVGFDTLGSAICGGTVLLLYLLITLSKRKRKKDLQ